MSRTDAGRDHADPTKQGFENYDGGFAAIESLFGTGEYQGTQQTTQPRLAEEPPSIITVEVLVTAEAKAAASGPPHP